MILATKKQSIMALLAMCSGAVIRVCYMRGLSHRLPYGWILWGKLGSLRGHIVLGLENVATTSLSFGDIEDTGP